MTPVDDRPSTPSTAGNEAPLPLTSLLRMTFEKWYADNIPRHAAALAFYTLFALAPLLLVAVALMEAIVGRENAETQLMLLVEQYVHSNDAAVLAQTVVDNALPGSTNWLITVGVILALLYGASNVFGELQVVLNIIWGIYQPAENLRRLIWERLIAIAMVVLSGLLIFLALLLNLWVGTVATWARGSRMAPPRDEQITYFILLFVVIAVVFAIIYKFVPAVRIAWHDVLIGAVATAFLVSVARLLITWYLSYNRIGSIYGAAGTLVILLLWAYYSAQIFFLGAEFTHIYSRTYGARRRGEVGLTPNKPASTPGLPAAAPTPVPEPIRVKVEAPPAQPPIAVDVLNLEPVERSWRGRWRGRWKTRWQRLWRALSRTRAFFAKLRRRGQQLIRMPIQLFRPLRELVMAVSIIGTLSLAALIGIPWHKRRKPAIDPPTSEAEPAPESEPRPPAE